MGRKPINKERNLNPEKRRQLALRLIPALKEVGIAELTMDEVAQKLGKSKATIYKYFRSQDELLDLAMESKLEAIKGFVPLLMNREKGFSERYREALQHLSIHLDDISNLFLADLRSKFPRLWEKVEMFNAMASLILKNFYIEGIAAGAFHQLHPGILALTDQVLFDALLNPQFLRDNQLSLREAFEQYFQLKFYGLSKTAKAD